MYRLLLLAGALLAALIIACGGDDDDVSSARTATPADGVQTPPPEATTAGASTPPAAETSAATEAPAEVTEVSLQRVFPDLAFSRMTGLYQLPDSAGRWLVTEQDGRVMLIDPISSEASVFLDLTARVNAGGFEEGLLGLAMAPDFEASGLFYVYYSAAGPRRSVLSRFSSDGSNADVSSEQVLLEIGQPFGNHNGGQIAFGPDGYLYVGLGDGGSARDPQGNGQNLGTLLGSLLRIDVAGDGGYAIPPDNPFVDEPVARGEIWAYGLRNVWRFSFDTATGDLWLGDVGQNSFEEVDIIEKGANYGWPITEGFECLDGGDNCDKTGLEPPLLDYGREDGCSITGGFVYRGSALPGLQGAYLYSDFCSGTIWALRLDGSLSTLAESGLSVSSFAQGNDGEIYVLDHNGGGIYKIVP